MSYVLIGGIGMNKLTLYVVVFLSVAILFPQEQAKQTKKVTMKDESKDRLAILWTSGDPEVAKNMVFLYAYNAKKYNWFKTIRFIVWGASTKLLSEDKELQERIKKMRAEGIELYACKWCSDNYGVSELLTSLGIEVIYYGKPLTKLIKQGWNILTF